MAMVEDTTVTTHSITVPKNNPHVEENLSGTVTASRPVVVFSRNGDGKTVTQMPPVETVGDMYYIPAIDLINLEATGQLKVTTTEDSTYVVIKGAYHEVCLFLSY